MTIHITSSHSFHLLISVRSREMLGQEVQESAKNLRYQEQIKSACNGVDKITAKLSKAERQLWEEPTRAGNNAAPIVWDWSSSYQKFADWEDVEDLREQKLMQEARVTTVMERNTNMGHYHDHSEERKLFEMPEQDKMLFCERRRLLGNALYEEGYLSKAAENYKLALSYYEYCFPESDSLQAQLDSVRQACLCNISLCYRRMGHFRLAIEAAAQAITQSHPGSSMRAKALFRRAQAYRELDEYANALADLRSALDATPGDCAVLQEVDLVTRRKAASNKSEKVMAKSMLHVESDEIRGDEGCCSESSVERGETNKAAVVWGDVVMPLEPIIQFHEQTN